MHEQVYIFIGCKECPFGYRSHYKTYLFCRHNPNIKKGYDSEHDLSNVTEYPSYCYFRRKQNIDKHRIEIDLTPKAFNVLNRLAKDRKLTPDLLITDIIIKYLNNNQNDFEYDFRISVGEENERENTKTIEKTE